VGLHACSWHQPQNIRGEAAVLSTAPALGSLTNACATDIARRDLSFRDLFFRELWLLYLRDLRRLWQG